VPAGSGYIVTARLVAAESGDELASYHESAKDAGDLIPSVDRVTKSLRGKIGESLKSVRDAPPLQQVSTASLGALRSYAAGLHANDVIGDYQGAIDYFHDAIRQDSNFAMAYVQLAFSLQTLGGRVRNAQANEAFATALRLRDRLPERERYNVEGAYYLTTANDRTKAIPALRHAVELDSTNIDAANSLANALSSSRDYVGAERFFKLALAGEPNNGTLLANLAFLYTGMGRHSAFDSVSTLLASRSASFPSGNIHADELWNRRDYDAIERLARAHADSVQLRDALDAQDGMVGIAVARGRLHEGERRFVQVNEAKARVRGDTVSPDFAAFQQACSMATCEAMRLAASLHSMPPSERRRSRPFPSRKIRVCGWRWAMHDSEPLRRRERC
jgi:FOG: TPR repeat